MSIYVMPPTEWQSEIESKVKIGFCNNGNGLLDKGEYIPKK